MQKIAIGTILALTVSGCGGSTTGTTSFQTMTVFSDDAGVAKGTRTDGRRMYYMAPNIVTDVAVSNESGPSPSNLDISSFPIVQREQGYNLRQGAIDGFNVIIAEKIGSDKASIASLYDNSTNALAVSTGALTGNPTGTQTYRGLYVVGQRATNWAETGSVTLEANFDSGSFSINASSDDTTLSGSGFVEVSSGQVSASNLQFTLDSGSYSATTLGLIGGADGSEIVGLWYTNDSDRDPDFAGGFATTK